MDRWNRWNRVFQDSEPSPDDPGSGEEETEDPETQDPNSSNPPTGIESGFTNERLAGMSPQEIENLVLMQEETIREQGRELNRSHSQPQPQPQNQPQPTETEDPEVDATEFWQDPLKHIREENRRTVERVRQELDQTIAPFKENLQSSAVQGAWNEFFSKHSDGRKYETLIREGLRQVGNDSPTYGDLSGIYYQIRGKLAEMGRTIDDVNNNNRGGGGNTQPNRQDPPMNPQHRPSSHPVSRDTDPDKPSRELTENEAKMARMRWPNLPKNERHKRFIAWQNMDEGAVIGSKIGKEN